MNNTINFTKEDFGTVITVKIDNIPHFVGNDVRENLVMICRRWVKKKARM